MDYLDQFYLKAVQTPDCDFTFAVPESFHKHKQEMNWPVAPNIHFRFLSDDELIPNQNRGILSVAWQGSLLIRKILKETKANSLFLIHLVRYMPFLPFLASKNTKIYGIIYRIYLYEWATSSFPKKVIDFVLNWLYANMSSFSRIFILNDKGAASYLNRIWRTDRFEFLVDPYFGGTGNCCPHPKTFHDKLTFIHLGALSRRKGTINILNALQKLSKTEQQRVCLIFAGQVHQDIRNEFYHAIDKLSKTIEIKVYDDYISFERIGELCTVSDYVLIPYLNTAQSSGIISIAAKYSIPVIGPRQGLLGKLIRSNNLGITLPDVSASSICDQIRKCIHSEQITISSDYLSHHTVSEFLSQIFSALTSR